MYKNIGQLMDKIRKDFLIDSDHIDISKEEITQFSADEIIDLYKAVSNGYYIEFAYTNFKFKPLTNMTIFNMTKDGLFDYLYNPENQIVKDLKLESVEKNIHEWQAF